VPRGAKNAAQHNNILSVVWSAVSKRYWSWWKEHPVIICHGLNENLTALYHSII